MSTIKQTIEPRRLAYSAAELAELLGVSERSIWAWHSAGRLPLPVRLSRAVRWPATEIVDWLAAGAPSREQWEAIRQRSKRIPT